MYLSIYSRKLFTFKGLYFLLKLGLCQTIPEFFSFLFFCQTQEGPAYTWLFNLQTFARLSGCLLVCLLRSKFGPYTFIKGQRDKGKKGKRDKGTKGKRDKETKGQRDKGTKGQREKGTKGQRDKGTKGQRDKGTMGQ